MSPSLVHPPIYGLPRTTFESSEAALRLRGNRRNVTCSLGNKHGCQSATLEVIKVKITQNIYCVLHLLCAKYETDWKKTEADITTCILTNQHGRQSAMLEVIWVNITYNLYFDMYLLCTEYEADRIKTKAVIARQKCYARQKMSKNRFGI